jgi:hypothetical protein
MERLTMVRYEVKPDRVQENERLVRAVYDELAASAPPGLSYVTFLLEDGVTFVHVAGMDTEDGRSLLAEVPAFRTFQEGLADRLVAPLTRTAVRRIGSHRVSGA